MARTPLASFTVHIYGPEGTATDENLDNYEGLRVPRWVRNGLHEYLRGDSGLTAEVVLDDDWTCQDCGGYHPNERRSCTS